MSQQLEALAVANSRRYGWRDLKGELLAGEITLQKALVDPRAARQPIHRLLNSQSKWGASRTRRLLMQVGIYPLTAVDRLTDRQREALCKGAPAIDGKPVKLRKPRAPRAAKPAVPSPPAPKKVKRCIDTLGGVITIAEGLGWSARLHDDETINSVVVMTPIGEKIVSDLEDLTFLLVDVEAA